MSVGTGWGVLKIDRLTERIWWITPEREVLFSPKAQKPKKDYFSAKDFQTFKDSVIYAEKMKFSRELEKIKMTLDSLVKEKSKK